VNQVETLLLNSSCISNFAFSLRSRASSVPQLHEWIRIGDVVAATRSRLLLGYSKHRAAE